MLAGDDVMTRHSQASSPKRGWYVIRRSVIRVNILQLLGIGNNCLLTHRLRLFCLQRHTMCNHLCACWPHADSNYCSHICVFAIPPCRQASRTQALLWPEISPCHAHFTRSISSLPQFRLAMKLYLLLGRGCLIVWHCVSWQCIVMSN